MSTQFSWMKFERNCVYRFLSGVPLKVNVMSFAFEMPSVSLAWWCLPLTVDYISISLKKYIFSQHQPLFFTNLGKANVTKHKKVVQNYLPNYLQRLCTRYRWVLILYATEHCYLNSRKRHVSAHFYFQILGHWDFKVNPGGKLWGFNLPCSNLITSKHCQICWVNFKRPIKLFYRSKNVLASGTDRYPLSQKTNPDGIFRK